MLFGHKLCYLRLLEFRFRFNLARGRRRPLVTGKEIGRRLPPFSLRLKESQTSLAELTHSHSGFFTKHDTYDLLQEKYLFPGILRFIPSYIYFLVQIDIAYGKFHQKKLFCEGYIFA